MLAVRSSIAVLIVLIGGVLPADPESEHDLTTDRITEAHDRSVNSSLAEYSEDWSEGGEELSPETVTVAVADNRRPAGGHKGRGHPVSPGGGGGHEDCCPSMMEMIEPDGGRNPEGLYVELYGDGADRQRFYEVSCAPGVEGKPCSFLERRLRRGSSCVQRYSYSYAIVHGENAVRKRRHDHGGGGTGQHNTGNKPSFTSLFPGDNVWKLDYIKVRSGCACTVQSSRNKTQQKNKHKKFVGGAGSGADGGGGGRKRSHKFRPTTIEEDSNK